MLLTADSPIHAARARAWQFCRTTSLIAAFLFSGFLVTAREKQSRITIVEAHATLEKIMKEISKQSGYTFLYDPAVLEKSIPVTVRIRGVSLEKALAACFKEQPLNYKLFSLTIVISAKETVPATTETKKTPPPAADPIRGKVTNPQGGALAGISVIIKGTNQGVTTDGSGNYSIDAPANATLVFSYVGYNQREIEVSGKNVLDVTMEENNSSLNQVVVVGYGTQKRKDLTGSVGTVSSRDIAELSVTRVDQALSGKVAGVQVKTVSGQPGAGPQIRVRGIGSISAGTDPLYVVDGFPTDNIQTLNPTDIESVDILKDASATAIYGSRGANGVVIINTKHGTANSSVVNFGVSYGSQKVTRIPKTMNAKQQAQYALDGLRNANVDGGNDVSGDPSTWDSPVQPEVLNVLSGASKTNTSMTRELLRTAPIAQYTLSAYGGSEKCATG